VEYGRASEWAHLHDKTSPTAAAAAAAAAAQSPHPTTTYAAAHFHCSTDRLSHRLVPECIAVLYDNVNIATFSPLPADVPDIFIWYL